MSLDPESEADQPIVRRAPVQHYAGEPVRLRVITAAEAAALPKPPADPLDALITELEASRALTPAAAARVRAAVAASAPRRGGATDNRMTGGPSGGH